MGITINFSVSREVATGETITSELCPGVVVHRTKDEVTHYVAELTTDHATSSYGLPVLVVDGVAYGPTDMIGGMFAADHVRDWAADHIDGFSPRLDEARDDYAARVGAIGILCRKFIDWR